MSVGLPLQELEAMDLLFDLPLIPRIGESGEHCGLIAPVLLRGIFLPTQDRPDRTAAGERVALLSFLLRGDGCLGTPGLHYALPPPNSSEDRKDKASACDDNHREGELRETALCVSKSTMRVP